MSSKKSAREVWAVTAVAQRLGCGEEKVRQMCAAGKFPEVEVNGQLEPGAFRLDGPSSPWRIQRASLDAYMAKLLEASRPKVRRKA